MGDGSGGTGNGTGAAAGAVGTDASEQQYSLRWNDFHHSILSSFRHLRDEEDFVDVTLACDGCSFTAHKVVLSACSPYFRRLLKANPCQHPIVILRDVKEKDMESLLRFMYNGEVHIGQDHLSDFLKTAQMLQVRGLADVPTGGRDSQNHHKRISTSNALPWSHGGNSDIKDTSYEDPVSPAAKRSRTSASAEHCFSPSPASSHGGGLPGSTSNHLTSGAGSDITLLSQALEGGGPTIHTGNTSHQIKGASDSSLQAQSTGEDSNSSDPEESVGGGRSGGGRGELVPKSEPNDYGSSPLDDSAPSHHLHHGNGAGLGGGGLDTPRTPTFPAALLGLQGIPGLLPGPSGIHNSNQEANFVSRRGLDMARVRATDPRPCPKCGKIYRSAHTLRTHLEDKHTICPGYRCVLCGTVAKSRNSLHSHMSRQHRGISTKDLPVLPMPSAFDPELASKLLAKAGVKVSPAELRARASPTGPRRPEMRLELRNHIGGGAPPSEAGSSIYGGDDPEDLTVTNSRFELSPPELVSSGNSAAVITKVLRPGPVLAAKSSIDMLAQRMADRAPLPPPSAAAAAAGSGSALIDTYLQMIAESSNLGLTTEHALAAAHAAKIATINNLKAAGHREEHTPDRNPSGNPSAGNRNGGGNNVESNNIAESRGSQDDDMADDDLESSGVDEDDYSEDEHEPLKGE